MGKTWVRWVFLVLAASPALIPPILILTYGVNIPFRDQWDPGLAGLYIKAHNHTLSLADFTAQHNEHRILVPRIAYFLLNSITGWNTIGEMLLGWLIVCGTSTVVLWLYIRTSEPTLGTALTLLTWPVIAFWFVCNLLLFAPTQLENWLLGLGVINVMPMAWILATFMAITSDLRPGPKMSFAILFASAATFSSGNGILVWPLAGAILAWSSSRADFKLKKWTLITWGAACVLNLALFFWNYKEPQHPPGEHAYFAGFFPMLQYTLGFLGAPFVVGGGLEAMTYATINAVVMLLLLVAAIGYFIYLWLRCHDYSLCQRMLVWFMVAGFAVASGFIASLFRAGIAVTQSLSSRYVTFSIHLPLALVVLIPMICRDARRRFGAGNAGGVEPALPGMIWHQLPAFFCGILIVMQSLGVPPALVAAEATSRSRRQAKAAVLLVNALPDNPSFVQLIYPVASRLGEEAKALSEMGYLHPKLIPGNNALAIEEKLLPPESSAEDNAPPAGPSTRKTVISGSIDEAGRIGSTRNVGLSGWAILPAKKRQADGVFLTYQNEKNEQIIFAFATIGIKLPDGMKNDINAAYPFSCWTVAYPPTAIPDYYRTIKVSAWALDTDTGKAFRLEGDAEYQP